MLICSDIHGRSFWRKVINSNLPVVFLGDFVDSYHHEQISWKQEYQEFLDIIQFAKENPTRVILLLGNHCGHYCGLSNDYARFNFEHAEELYEIYNSNKDLFKIAYRKDNILFSHAGISTGWLKENNIEEDPNTIVDILNSFKAFNRDWIDYLLYNKPKKYNKNPLAQIGRSRGGDYWNGSPLWADLGEMIFNSAFQDSLIQICAHSQLKDTGTFICNNNYYCCDSRAVFIWNGNELKLYE